MKKIVLAAVFAVASMAANAQVWMGGEVGYQHTKVTNNGNTLSKENIFTLAPEIGYTLNDKWDIAAGIGFGHTDDDNASTNSFILNPYARYKAVKAGNFTFFLDGGFAYQLDHTHGVDDNTNSWEIAIKPGFSYAISPKVSLVAHVGKFGWAFSKRGDVKANQVNIGVDNAVAFGAYVSF